MNWIKNGTTLTGEVMLLLPLEKKHFQELNEVAKEIWIWEFHPVDMSTDDKRLIAFARALEERDKGNQFPFVVFHQKEKKIIGSTRLMDIHFLHRKLEIGWTWLHPDYWATAVNLECKFLLLSFSFEELKALRVQLKTDENNIRSRKAIAKIGGQYEGILRKDILRDNGTSRNSVYFSLLDNEWERAKINLQGLLQRKLMDSI